MMGMMMGFKAPKIEVLGSNFAGIVVEIGPDVSGFQVGDVVYGTTGGKMKAHAEYISIAEDEGILPLPSGWSMEEAAAFPFGAITAMDYLTEKIQLEAGQAILINGASGAVGVAAVQLAKYLGARVTAVCSTVNIDLVKSLGADEVIDYTKDSVLSLDRFYDVIMDNVGNFHYNKVKMHLKPKGRFLAVIGSMKLMIASLWLGAFSGKRAITGIATDSRLALEKAHNLGLKTAIKPVLDRVFPLQSIVEAHRYVDTGRKKGNVVISF
jgi:NADPH:quinone reductase-like Zn-dependent oxidoreductase